MVVFMVLDTPVSLAHRQTERLQHVMKYITMSSYYTKRWRLQCDKINTISKTEEDYNMEMVTKIYACLLDAWIGLWDNHDYNLQIWVNPCHHPYKNKNKSSSFLWSSMIIIWMHVVEWCLRWLLNMKCIASMWSWVHLGGLVKASNYDHYLVIVCLVCLIS